MCSSTVISAPESAATDGGSFDDFETNGTLERSALLRNRLDTVE
jgi:hypothetical protein